MGRLVNDTLPFFRGRSLALCRVARVWIVLAVILPLCALQAAPGAASSALDQFFQRYLNAAFILSPVDATRLGDHRFDHLLDDPTVETQARTIALLRKTLEDLPSQVPYAGLTADGKVDFEILRDELETQLWLIENFRPYEEDPRSYNGLINDSVYLLLTQSSLPAETNVSNVLARMSRIPRVIQVAKQRLERPPRVHTETAIRQNLGAIGFYQRDLLDLVPPARRAEVESAARPVVAALQDYQAFLEKELLPRATGEWRLGREKFSKKLERVLNAGLTADAVLAEAESEFARVQRDMYVIARQLWAEYHPDHPLPPDDAEGRRETVRSVLGAIAIHHGTAATLTDDVRRTVEELKKFIAEHDIIRLPDPDRCQIIEMPEFQRGNSTAYMNSPPPLDPEATGYYAVSPPPKDWDADRVRSYLEEYNHAMLRILSIHEAYPGHYVQLEYANRHPSLIRKVLGSGVYIEGWAVYTEQTMLDQGFGGGDLPLRLTQLKFYLRAVANTILDHRMHCSNLGDDEAMDLLVRQSYQSEGEARLKVIRAKQSSAQLSTYFVGRMAHYRLRQAVQREMGDRFRLGRFHEAVLAPGAVPMKYLPDLVRRALN